MKHDAWDVIVEISSICNQLKSNTCKAKEPCMLISPKDQDLAMQWTSSTSPLLWLFSSSRTSHKPSCSHFPRVHTQIRNFSSLCSLFLLRKELGSSLKSILSSHGSTLWKKDKAPSYFFFILPLRKKTQEALSTFSYPRVKHQKERKLSTLLSLSHLQVQQQEGSFFQLSQALYLLYFWVQPLRKGNPFM